MHTSATILALTSLVSLVSAQQTYVIDPNSVSDALKQYWCDQQQTQCPLICLQSTTGVPRDNDCTASTLTYACVCSDGLSPNLTQYSQTLPYFICTEWGNQCVSNCGRDAGCASDCRSQHLCGAQSPVRVNASTVASATPSATSGGGSGGDGAVQTGFASPDGGSSGSGSDQEGNGARSLGAAAGWAVLGGTFVVGFAGLL